MSESSVPTATPKSGKDMMRLVLELVRPQSVGGLRIIDRVGIKAQTRFN